MALKSLESQNVEFKSNWPKARLERDEAGGNYKCNRASDIGKM
jgi:hypothetical protein